jgi:DNA-binding NarL/FixJ family response regulator
VACGACWEQAIRDDERFAVQHELPRQLQADPDLLDDVAISRASHGDPVHLTNAERREAVRRLRSSGLTITQIATRLRMSNTGVARELDKLEAQMAVAS